MNVDVVIGEILTLSIMAFALGMDAFSVGLGIGMTKLTRKQYGQISVLIGLFHVIMPLGGMVAGQFLSDTLGVLATYMSSALLLVLGIQMISASFNKNGKRVISPTCFNLLVFAVGVSLDSFSVGLSLGLYGTKPILTISLFGLFSMVLTWAGLLLGKKVQSWLGAYSQALGGTILLSFGIKLLLTV
ncbi:manganese efflux pump MntP family protein [Bacillus sp. CLL-7-23]|uniref:Putative manganese efflux pump MntP n=1 Tax=Bacillus changyiensis TaxID=3004103 RepID=A0ABT4WZC8_9BACI|nr:manganese efflux pump MntP family protein [Bacillus changyiensis]MDA7025384.1 manganese efflux pump MntP family protein [Bacillus changyiensis]